MMNRPVQSHHGKPHTSIILVAFLIMLVASAMLTAFASSQPQSSTQQPHHTAAILADQPLVADAGPNKTVTIGFKNALDASNTTPSDAVSRRFMIFTWTFWDGSNITKQGVEPSYAWSTVGVHVVKLNVSLRDTWFSEDTVVITVVPFADAGPSQNVTLVNKTYTMNFDGSLSSAGTNTIVNFTWAIYRGGDLVATLYGFDVNYTFTRAGTYSVILTILDNQSNAGSTEVSIRISNPPNIVERHPFIFFLALPAVVIGAVWVWRKLQRDHELVTKTDMEKLRLQWKGFRKTWRIFRSNRVGFGGFIVLLIFAGMAIAAPILATVQNPTNLANQEPSKPDLGWMNPLPPSLTPSPYSGFVHPLGTDHKGQDIYSMTLFGSRASLEVGLIATLISVAVGASVGLAAGYFGKVTDEVLMRTTDFFLVLPWFPLMIVMMAILGQKFIWVVIVIGITSWPSTARVVRSQVLTVKERQFIVRAKCVGASDSHIIKTHILPNVLPLVFANTVLLIAIAIFSEAFLDFFGLGDPSVISWGGMLESAYEQDAFLLGAWWWIAAPGIAIVAMVLAFSLVGYAIDDVLNPKLRRR